MEHKSTRTSITPQQHAVGTRSQVIDLKISGAFGYGQGITSVTRSLAGVKMEENRWMLRLNRRWLI
jgi:hypothetical protein